MTVDLDVAIAELLFAKETGELKCGELKGVIEVLKRLSRKPHERIDEDPEQKTGAWIEKETFLAEEHGVDVLQSARCTRCGKYHTTPYLYYFKEDVYCPSCGSKNGMKGE